MASRVLVPYDTSEEAEYALEYATTFFDAADIVLLHVVEPFPDHTAAGGYDSARSRERLEAAEEMLEDVSKQHERGEDIETVIEYGRPIHRILGSIDTHDVDHVVMGSHGRDGAVRLLLGSVAETVTRRSPVPVTVARKPATDTSAPTGVLVPFDASSPAQHALEYALTEFDDAGITAVFVAHPTADDREETDHVFDVLENWTEERANYVDSVLTVATELADEHDRTIETEHVDGKPARAIVEQAENDDIGHVVMGASGRNGLPRLLLGSVAETVLRRSPVTVTVIK